MYADQAIVDVIVVGGGPAGSAAAITAARHGLSVVLVEAARFPRFRPGETLAEATGKLIERLVGREAFGELATLRFMAIHRAAGGPIDQESGATPTAGLHVHRAELDAALLDAAVRAGVCVLQPACAKEITPTQSLGWRVRTTQGELQGRFVIDASGGTRWLSRALQLDVLMLSEALQVRYQYGCGADLAAPPAFAINQDGWSWTTGLPGEAALWATMDFPGQPPSAATSTNEIQAMRHSPCTWRIASQLAASNFALTGDAACQVDPASSHGVLRALTSGIAAAEAVAARRRDTPTGEDALLAYCRAITEWFLNDCRLLHLAYQQASRLRDPVGFAERFHIFFNQEGDYDA